MPAARHYVALHDFHTVVDKTSGREGLFRAGQPYDGLTDADLIASLLTGHDFKGPLIAEQTSPAVKPADSEVK